MSVRMMGEVFELKLKPTEALVLIALADHADHDGGGVYPSVPLIAWKTGFSVRTVQYVMRGLEEQGLLELVEEATRYRPREYRLRFDLAQRKPERKLDRGAGAAPLPGVQVTPGVQMATSETLSGVQVTTSEGGSGVQPVAPEPSLREPSGRRREPSTRARARATPTPHAVPLPEEATLSEAGRQYAQQGGCTRPDEAWAAMCDWAWAKGALRANWEAAWRQWVRTAHDDDPRHEWARCQCRKVGVHRPSRNGRGEKRSHMAGFYDAVDEMREEGEIP